MGCKGSKQQTLDFNESISCSKISILKANSVPAKIIKNPDQIKTIVNYISRLKQGWYAPWYGVPVSKGRIVLGETFWRAFSLGIGDNYFEVQIGNGFYIRDSSEEEINGILKLAGLSFADLEEKDSAEDKIMAAATKKMKSLKPFYQPMRALYDDGNEYWEKYTKNYSSKKDKERFFSRFPFIKKENFQVVYFCPAKPMLDGDLWIFIDKKTFQVVGCIRGG